MDIKQYINKVDCTIPIFADFFLKKYRSLAINQPDEAEKLEKHLFTNSFLLSIINGKDSLLKSKMLNTVPHHLFTNIIDDVTDLLENGKLEDIDFSILAPVIHSLRPDKISSILQKQIEKEKNWDDINSALYWLNFFDFLPVQEQKKLFQSTLLTLNKHEDTIKTNPDAYYYLSGMVKAAVDLKHPETAFLLKHFLTCLIEGDYSDEFQLQNIYIELLDSIIDARFELDLYFVMDYWEFDKAPNFLDHFYKEKEQSNQLFQAFKELSEYKTDIPVQLIISCLDKMKNNFIANILRVLLEDKELEKTLKKLDVFNGILAVFISIIWQEHRKKEIDIKIFSDKEIEELILFDSIYIPCSDEIKKYLSNMKADTATSFLNKIQDKIIVKDDYDLAYSHGNLIKYMDHFKDTSFIPVFFKGLLHGCKKENNHLINAACTALIHLKDASLDYLSIRIEEFPDNYFIELLDIIKAVGSKKAENLLIENFDLFIKKDRIDTLNTCESLLSLKALNLLDHKVGKNQTAIDRLFILVNMLNGKENDRIKKVYQSYIDKQEKQPARIDNGLSENELQTLTLELECPECGDISDYECSNIYFAEGSPPFIADELTCIVCNTVPHFQVTVDGMLIIQMEFIRSMAWGLNDETEDEYSLKQSPINLSKTKILGKVMPLAEGIALYNQRTIKNPKDPSNYIGLGNIYKHTGRLGQAETEFKKAIKFGASYIEAYMSLSQLSSEKGDSEEALTWLEKGRPFLKRPIICKNIDTSAEDIYDHYLDEHYNLLMETKSSIPSIQPFECIPPGKNLRKIGRNEKCPCGSGKKYKKCCIKTINKY